MTLWNVCLVCIHTYIEGIRWMETVETEQMSKSSSVDRPVILTCIFMLEERDMCYLTSVWEVGDMIPPQLLD